MAEAVDGQELPLWIRGHWVRFGGISRPWSWRRAWGGPPHRDGGCRIGTGAAASGRGLPFDNDYAFGLDLSFLKQGEDGGMQLKDDGVVKPGLRLFQDHGYNWGRVHICNDPVRRRPQKRQYVAAAGADIKKPGMWFLLDFMFSNGWANPMTSRYGPVMYGVSRRRSMR